MALDIEPLINGIEYGWSDIRFTLKEIPTVGVTAIKYEEDMDKENIYGAGRYPVARGRGRVKCSASITLLGSTVMNLKAAAPKGKLHLLNPFNIIVSYQPEVGAIITHTLKNCEFKKTSFDWKEGDMYKAFELELIISEIKES